MIPSENTSSQLLTLIKAENLYQHLIQQLLKDFELSGLDLNIASTTKSEALIKVLQYQISHLMIHNFDAYLQLLYRIDIPEEEMQTTKLKSVEELTQKAVYMILNREWQKVYYKDKFS